MKLKMNFCAVRVASLFFILIVCLKRVEARGDERCRKLTLNNVCHTHSGASSGCCQSGPDIECYNNITRLDFEIDPGKLAIDY